MGRVTAGPFAAFRDEDFQWWTQRLVDAGDTDTVHRTLGLRDRDGRNAWFAARAERNEVGAYLDDLERARRLADTAAGEGDPATRAAALGLQCRYALIQATLGDVASRFAPEITARLVETGLWTREQALAWASVSHNTQSALEAVAAAVRAAGGSDRDVLMENLLLTRERVVTEARTLTLAALARDAHPHETARLLESIASEENEALRFGGLVDIAPLLPTELLTRARSIARGFEQPDNRARALAAVAAALPEGDRDACYAEALAAAADELRRPASTPISARGADLLKRLAGELPLPHVDRLLPMADDAGLEGNDRYKVWGAVCRRYAQSTPDRAVTDATGLPKWERDEVLLEAAVSHARGAEVERALARIGEIEQEPMRARALQQLAPVLADPALPAIVDETARLGPNHRIEVLRAIADAAEAPARALQAFAESLRRRDERLEALVAIAPVLPSATIDAIVDELLEPDGPAGVATQLELLAPFLSAEQVRRALDLVAAEASGLPFRTLVVRLAEASAPEEALDRVLARPDPAKVSRPRELAALCPRLPARLLPRVIEAMQPRAYAQERVRARTALAPALPPSQAAAVVTEAAALGRSEDRVRALADLVTAGVAQAEPAFAKCLRAGIEAAENYAELDAMVAALERVAAGGESMTLNVLTAVLSIGRRDVRLRALLHVALGGTADAALAAASAAVALLLTAPEELVAVAQRVSGVSEASGRPLTAAVLGVDDQAEFAVLLDGLAHLLDDESLPEVSAAAANIADPASRLIALAALLGRASPELRQQVLDSETARAREWANDPELSVLGAKVLLAADAPPGEPVVEQALGHAAEAADPLERVMAVVVLAREVGPSLPDWARTAAFDARLELDPPARGRAVALAAPIFGSEEVERARTELRDDAPWCEEARDALIALALRAVRLGDHELAFSCLRDLPDTFETKPRMVRVVGQMPLAMLRTAAEIAPDADVTVAASVRAAELGDVDLALDLLDTVSSGSTRETALTSLCRVARPEWLDRLLEEARALRVGPRADALAALVEHTPTERRAPLVVEAVRAADGHQGAMEAHRLAVLRALRSELYDLPKEVVCQLWTEAMHAGAPRARSDVLTTVAGLAPALIFQLGRDVAVAINGALTVGAGDAWP